jgi:phosphatidylserine/phosphatidylglycerophosphate/cardiolipin synthase-like enzyme
VSAFKHDTICHIPREEAQVTFIRNDLNHKKCFSFKRAFSTKHHKRYQWFFWAALLLLEPKMALASLENSFTKEGEYTEKLTHKRKREESNTIDSIFVLSSREEHMEVFKQEIKNAKKSILITSYGVFPPNKDDVGIYALLKKARKRGVKIYIYGHPDKALDEATVNFFEDYSISYDDCNTHAKILTVDHSFVSIGSYSLLSKPQENEWSNYTFCIRDEEVTYGLIEEIWTHLKYYRNLQFGNWKQVQYYENNPYNSGVPTWKNGKLEYIPSLDAHRSLIQEAFETAAERVIIFSPFINLKSGCLEDFNENTLSKTLKKGIVIIFFCREDDEGISSLQNYLGRFQKEPNLYLFPIKNFHHKTIIVDDHLVTAGSFNWLSASRDKESGFSNHEATLVHKGKTAKAIIKSILSETGVKIPSNTIKKTPILKTKKDEFKKSWLDLKEWDENQKGNYSRALESGRITLFKKNNQWSYVHQKVFSQETYKSLKEALHASYKDWGTELK